MLVDRCVAQRGGHLVEGVTHLPVLVGTGTLLEFTGEMLSHLGARDRHVARPVLLVAVRLVQLEVKTV
jgi:hypothetical protein